MSDTALLVLYHKQRTSARLRFLRHAHGGICADAVLPADAAVAAGACAGDDPVRIHPGMLLRAAEAALALPRGSLEADAGFRCHVHADGRCTEVYLAQFGDIDPPTAAAGARRRRPR